MKSITELYKIGRGPSSSHTMGPSKAATLFSEAMPIADKYKAVLYGSLALTGKGHQTDKAIIEVLGDKCEVEFNTTEQNLKHPNTMRLIAYKDGKEALEWEVLSVGGGAIQVVGQPVTESEEVYRLNTFDEIKKYCYENDMTLPEYVYSVEPFIKPYLKKVWKAMCESIARGVKASGVLDGGLEVARKAKRFFLEQKNDKFMETKEGRLICAYAFAVAEENADGKVIVTAPTCGSCGVVPSVLRYMQERYAYSDDKIIDALAVAGLIGNVIKQNASISGAECGCQAEIGSACSMAAAGVAQLMEMEIEQIEYAAEVGMEHHLGLTCDPVCGLVQIPCIERNAVAAMMAMTAVNFANFLTVTRKVSFDTIVKTMYETGKDLPSGYRETSTGGLAKNYKGHIKSQTKADK
ncbi:MAG: L-serine ammonia-lyase, iron-sulfur-dependent, subunit alpha [Christensenellales bacterium]